MVGLIYFLLNKDKSIKYRNIFLLAASWYFYGTFKWWFLCFLVYIILVNYFGAIAIQKHVRQSKLIITTTIVLSIALLATMKYAYLFSPLIILPVGLSFFIFQALSYSIDVYRKKIEAEKDFVKVALYISFLPTILSGPIERARNLFPQLSEKTPMNYENILKGAEIFIYGLFKKVVIADRLSLYVNEVYIDPSGHTGSTLAMASLLYSIQIYCDFSGYTDMAIGTGRFLGFRIMDNFKFPYFATSIKDFWRRWHISLTSWFTEYVYISLGGNRVARWRWILNICAIFILSGIWHGATLGFVIWGMIHAVAYLVDFLLKIDKKNFLYGLGCFLVVTIAWIYFRIEDSTMATTVVAKIFSNLNSPVMSAIGGSSFTFVITMALTCLFVVREIVLYKATYRNQLIINVESVMLLLIIALFGVSSNQFVYFQF